MSVGFFGVYFSKVAVILFLALIPMVLLEIPALVRLAEAQYYIDECHDKATGQSVPISWCVSCNGEDPTIERKVPSVMYFALAGSVCVLLVSAELTLVRFYYLSYFAQNLLKFGVVVSTRPAILVRQTLPLLACFFCWIGLRLYVATTGETTMVLECQLDSAPALLKATTNSAPDLFDAIIHEILPVFVGYATLVGFLIDRTTNLYREIAIKDVLASPTLMMAFGTHIQHKVRLHDALAQLLYNRRGAHRRRSRLMPIVSDRQAPIFLGLLQRRGLVFELDADEYATRFATGTALPPSFLGDRGLGTATFFGAPLSSEAAQAPTPSSQAVASPRVTRQPVPEEPSFLADLLGWGADAKPDEAWDYGMGDTDEDGESFFSFLFSTAPEPASNATGR
eukprot:TRINITY_DN16464_c0_g1_i1.p1 TRINITY_DN16464_c0_g1~~TRINITY_DN16464_c0_g1_i1.p1  ORF type:complete len:446 (+),score=65.39 TRINITY_DN16464_c0_g1_i1:155-1339(+)